MTNVDNIEDILDSRDIIKRLEELEDLDTEAAETGEPMDEDDREELRILRDLAEEGESLADWHHGETLVRDSYFKEYAQELAEDTGMMPEGNNWPLYCIDWDWAARELRMDYTPIEFDGVTYWGRS